MITWQVFEASTLVSVAPDPNGQGHDHTTGTSANAATPIPTLAAVPVQTLFDFRYDLPGAALAMTPPEAAGMGPVQSSRGRYAEYSG